MGIGLSGLTSGMDTDAVVEAMVMEKTARKDSYVKARTKLEWKQDAWKELNSKIYSFYTKTLSNMRMAGSYNKTTVSVSNPSIASIVAQNGSVNGTQSLAVEKLAKAGYLTGGQVKTTAGGKVSKDTKLSELGIGDTSINIKVAGKETVIDINSDTTVDDFVSELKKAGVNASFDATNQRFFISAKESGEENDFSFTAADASGVSALKSLGLYTGATTADLAQYREWASYTEDYVINTIVAGLFDEQKTDMAKEKARLESENEAWKKANEELEEKNKKLTDEVTTLGYKKAYAEAIQNGTKDDYISNIDTQMATYEQKIADGTELTEDEQKEYDALKAQKAVMAEVEATMENGTLTEADKQAYIDGLSDDIAEKNGAIGANQAVIDENQAKMDANQEILDDVTEDGDGNLTSTKLQEVVDEKNAILEQELTDENLTKWRTATQYTYKSAASYDGDGNALDKEGKVIATKTAYDEAVAAIGDIGDITATGNSDGTGAVRVEGQDAIIWLNGAKFEGASNTISVNGLTITAQEVTGKDSLGNLNTVSVTTSTDAQGVYDMVKEFLKGYNELINEMDKLYNADSARGYEPLTSEQKEEMTDKDIELWEKKVKDSLLRRDSSLNNIINVMKNSLAGGVDIDGKRSYLSEFGIQTAGYLYSEKNERGAYHIDGDKDDGLSASKTDKLMAAILEDPERVTEVISGIAGKLYDNMTTAMRSTSLSSTYTVYNDKQMKVEYNRYTEKIADAEEDISWWEDYYRSKFTAMESMLASLNSQQSSLSGLIG